MQVCLSVCARRVSLADPRLSVPVRINLAKKEKYGPHFEELKKHIQSLRTIPVLERFNEIAQRNAERMATLHAAMPNTPSMLLLDNALELASKLSPASVDLIITSPPYAGAQKYIRASSLSLGWLDLAYEGELRPLERKTIGREHFPDKRSRNDEFYRPS
jgi:hypothetical protein